LVQLQRDLEQFKKYKLQIVGISYDNVDVLKKFSDAKAITFPLLSDEGSKVIRELGLEYKKGLPHPGTIVIDSAGVVRGKIFKKGYVQRHTTPDLLELMATLDLAQPESPENGKQEKGAEPPAKEPESDGTSPSRNLPIDIR
jgi:peroxiredoxin